MVEHGATRTLIYRLARFSNLIAAVLCVGVFLLFSTGAVVALHEGGWIEAFFAIPATALCVIINFGLGLAVWLVTRSGRPATTLRYVGLAIAGLSVVGLLVLCLLLY